MAEKIDDITNTFFALMWIFFGMTILFKILSFLWAESQSFLDRYKQKNRRKGDG